jgi:hypothetical protein
MLRAVLVGMLRESEPWSGNRVIGRMGSPRRTASRRCSSPAVSARTTTFTLCDQLLLRRGGIGQPRPTSAGRLEPDF